MASDRQHQTPLAAALFLGMLAAQLLIGGAKMVNSIPAYALIAAAALLTLRPPWRANGFPQPACLLTALAFIGYILGRAASSPVEYLARPDFLAALAALVVYLLTAFYLVDARPRLIVGGLLFFAAFAHVIVGLIQFKEGDNFMPFPWTIRYQYGDRASGFYICPNHLAGLLELLGVMALSIGVWARWRAAGRILAFYAAFVCYAGVAITGSRGGYLSTAFSLGVFALLTLLAIRVLAPDRFWKLVPAVTAGVVALVGIALFFMFQSDALKFRVHMIADTNNVRWLLWAPAIQQFFVNPLWGTGAGTYLYYGRQFRSDQVQNDPVYVHNDYLHLLAEFGAVGAALLIPLLVCHLAAGFRATMAIVRHRLQPNGLAASNALAAVIAATAGVAAYLVHSVFDFNLHLPANAMLMAFLFGILANPGPGLVRLPAGLERAGRWIGPAVAGAGLWLAVAAIPRWPGEYYAESARIALRDSMWPEAVERATIGLGLDPANPNLHGYLGEALRLLGHWAGSSYDRGRYFRRAEQVLKQGLQVFPQDLRLLIQLGATLDELAQYAEARLYYERALAADPNFGNAHAFFGLHLQRVNDVAGAESHYREAIRLDPGNDIAREGLKWVAQQHALPPHLLDVIR